MQKILVGTMAFYYFYILGFLFYMFTQRKNAVKSGELSIKHFKSYSEPAPEKLQVIQNHFNNQFQIPVIFFIVCLLTLQQNKVSVLTIVLAIVFVLSRIVHSFIHLGSNDVMKRAKAFFVGILVVGMMFVLNVI